MKHDAKSMRRHAREIGRMNRAIALLHEVLNDEVKAGLIQIEAAGLILHVSMLIHKSLGTDREDDVDTLCAALEPGMRNVEKLMDGDA